MDNHLHLVVRGELEDITTALKKVNIRYAMKLNKEKERVGHVFQDRYKSEIIHNEMHLLHVIRYIHNNPVKAKIVRSPEDYQWSSFGSYAGKDSEIIEGKVKQEILEIAGGLDSFLYFHREKDYTEFMDTPEEVENNREEHAQTIIKDYLNDNGIVELGPGKSSSKHMDKIVKLLLKSTSLSHRKVAKMLEIDNNRVHSISRSISKE
ncbi:MAG: hypothetical protein D5S00_10235 [Tindallia sp. MSAO_Bac2]|nr:MAG: hypothetical protein D5S00_10235 [Tindallia sp. MSAO_Bac2]